MPYYGLSTEKRTAASSVVLSLSPPEVDLNVPSLQISQPSSLLVIPAEVDLNVTHVPILADIFNSITLAKGIPETDLNVSNSTITTGSATDLVLTLHIPETDLNVSSLGISTTAIGVTTLNLFTPETDLNVTGPIITTGTVDDTTLSLVTAEVDLNVASLAITLGTAGITTLAFYMAEVDLNVAAPTILAGTVDETTLALVTPEVDLGVSAPAITTGAIGETTLSVHIPEIDLNVSAPTIVTLAIGETTLGLTTAEVDLNVSSIAISTDTVGDVTLGLFISETDLNVSNLGITSQALGSTTLSLNVPEVDFNVSNVPMFVETPPVEQNQAACGNGFMFMYSAPSSFTSYLASTANGYVSIWYKFTGDPGLYATDHKMTLFQAINLNNEDWLEVGIGRHANTAYPDLYIERGDNGPEGEKWTYLEEEESLGGRTVPDLYDGNWHHLVFGNENAGVTTPDGWYFWIDGEQYGEIYFVTFGPINVWFSEVQANSNAPFDELNISFSHLVGPQPPPPSSSGENQNLVGCIDEAMVINDRTIHDRGGTSGEVVADVAYLWNSGLGKLAEEVEAENPNGIWDDTYNVWKFESSGLGTEMKDPTGTGDHNVPILGNVTNTAGIPGGTAVTIAASFQSGALPSPSLYSNFVNNGPMSRPTNAITFAVWYKPEDSFPNPDDGTLNPCLGSMWNNTAFKEWALYRFATGSTNRWTMEVRTGAFGSVFARVDLGGMDSGKWYFIAGSFNVISCDVYVWWRDAGANQNAFQINNSSASVFKNTDAQFTIGTRAGENQPAQGLIDDVIYFNERLPNTGTTESLEWLFNDGDGRSLANIKSNDLAFYNRIASHWNMNQEGDGTQTRFDGADGTGSAANNYGQPVSLLVSGNVGTATGHISD